MAGTGLVLVKPTAQYIKGEADYYAANISKVKSIEDLLTRAEEIEMEAASINTNDLALAMYSPMTRVPKYAISRLFRAVGWQLRWDVVVQYLHSRCASSRDRHTFVSFNYDLALEHALELAQVSWSPRRGWRAVRDEARNS